MSKTYPNIVTKEPLMHNKDYIYSIETLELTTYKEAVQHQGWKNAMFDKNFIPFSKTKLAN
jgi:hypothetical protein